MRDARISRRQFLVLAGSIPILFTLPNGRLFAATLRIRKLRSWSAPDHTRIVLDLDAPPGSFQTRAYSDPPRVVLEIPGAIADPVTMPVDDGILARIVVDTTIPGTTLVRAELVRDADFVAFHLEPTSPGDTHRIVIDVNKRFTAAEKLAQEREVERVRDSGDVVVAVDAGHGGNDPGCLGRGPDGGILFEKSVSLDVARQLAAAIDQRPRMRSVLTRQKDYFVPLGRRPQIAQKYGARVFVSIHCNSAPSKTARGTEVFFVSLQAAADKATQELADRENAADKVGGLPPGTPTSGSIIDILVSMKQNEAIRRSERLGEIVLKRLEQVPGSETRGLKQGPLAVLKSITCPSVLVELGFITNARDARMLADASMRRLYADQIAGAVEEYVRSVG